MPTYPIIRYPLPVANELRKIQAAPGSQQISAPPGRSQKFRLPSKPQYLLDFPWYTAIITLVAAIAVIYKLMSLLVIALILGAGIGVGIKYAIDHHKWKKQVEAAKKRARSIAAEKAKVPNSTPPAAPIIYPNWNKITNLETSLLPSEAQVGVSEQFFLTHAQKYFSTACFGRKHPHPNREEKYWYSSDIEIILPGLGIQVEIDEPYEGKQSRPHHCSDDSGDKQRDIFFLERGWIIIRFAERQVVESPVACCRVIGQVLAELTGERSCLDAIGKQQPLAKTATWTTKEAMVMAKKNFRHQYLIPAGLWRK
jgi:hypothetical protein